MRRFTYTIRNQNNVLRLFTGILFPQQLSHLTKCPNESHQLSDIVRKLCCDTGLSTDRNVARFRSRLRLASLVKTGLNPLTARVKPWLIESFLTFYSINRTRSMTIHWKAVEQYFTVMLYVNPLTPRLKPWVIQSLLTFDSMDRTLKCDHLLESC